MTSAYLRRLERLEQLIGIAEPREPGLLVLYRACPGESDVDVVARLGHHGGMVQRPDETISACLERYGLAVATRPRLIIASA